MYLLAIFYSENDAEDSVSSITFTNLTLYDCHVLMKAPILDVAIPGFNLQITNLQVLKCLSNYDLIKIKGNFGRLDIQIYI